MSRSTDFRSLAEVQAAAIRSREERDRIQSRLSAHFDTAREPDFRRALIGGMVSDMFRSWRPLRSAASMLGGSPAALSTVLGLALGAKARTPAGRVAMTVLSAAAPLVLGKLGQDPVATGGKLVSELGTSWDHVKQYVRERRAALRARRSTT